MVEASVINMILTIMACLLLSYAGWYDYKFKLVEIWLVILLLIVGIINLCFIPDPIEMLAVVFFFLFIWGIPTLFGFGLGDFLLFMGLSLFIPNVQVMGTFYLIFIICWVAWTIIMLFKENRKLNLRNIYHYEYPLVPVIAFSFYIWLVIT